MQQLPVRLTLAQCSRQLAGIRKLLLHLLLEHFCRLITGESKRRGQQAKSPCAPTGNFWSAPA